MQQQPHRFLRALAREAVDRTPVWIMRQAGRYLPEYRRTRERAGSFMNLCSTPEMACEVTLQPLERFPLDAAILFSDILTVPGAMGLGLDFKEGEGPRFATPVRTEAQIDALPTPDPETELRYVMDAVRLIRRELHERVPLIGFAGSPWTLACYMVEGGGSKDFIEIKRLIHGQPAAAHRLLAHMADCVGAYLRAQIAAGAQALMLFDTWGGVLTPRDYHDFSLFYMARIVDALPATTPLILFTKGGGAWLEDIAATGCRGVGIDWTVSMSAARARIGDRVAIQGNMDPAILRAPVARIREEVASVLAEFGAGSGHIMNLGHGVQPDMQPEHVEAFVQAVVELSPAYHRAD
jgi:uroporphyrinogen decarboxylase